MIDLSTSENMDVASFPVSTASKAKTLAVTTVRPLADFGFSAGEMAAADLIAISCFTNGCNLLWDGSTPTTTFGHPLSPATSILYFEGTAKINALKVVSQTGTSNVTITLEQY